MHRYFLSAAADERSRRVGDKISAKLAHEILRQGQTVLVVATPEIAAAVASQFGFERPFELATGAQPGQLVLFATRPQPLLARRSRANKPVRGTIEYRYGTLPKT